MEQIKIIVFKENTQKIYMHVLVFLPKKKKKEKNIRVLHIIYNMTRQF